MRNLAELPCDRAVESPGDVTHKMRQFSIPDLYILFDLVYLYLYIYLRVPGATAPEVRLTVKDDHLRTGETLHYSCQVIPGWRGWARKKSCVSHVDVTKSVQCQTSYRALITSECHSTVE